MGKLLVNGDALSFYCPGCGEFHTVNRTWAFNGDSDRPTFSPSIKVTSGHFLAEHKPGDRCWCTYNAEHPDDPTPFHCEMCHSFVENGQIRFLDDCSHALAGQTVDLPEIEG